jgi:hypothetical protein
MEEPLKYYFANNAKECVLFDKYTIDKNGVVRNEKKEALVYSTNKKGYQKVDVCVVSGKRRGIQIGRAIVCTFLGQPPTLEHTADHIDQNPSNNNIANLRWATKKEQNDNQTRPDILKTAFLIVHAEKEKTAKEWVEYFNSKNEKNSFGREYTEEMIKIYVRRNQNGFAYKEYPYMEGEVWKEVEGSKTKQGVWMISNMCRVKYVTKYAENVLSGVRLGLLNGYPMIRFGGKNWKLHIVAFMTFFPDKWANKKPDEMVLHEEDNKMDFRPEMLRLGTKSENGTDAHDNGKYDGTRSEKQKCASYIKGVFEKDYDSQSDAAEYLRSNGYEKARQGKISTALIETNKHGSPKTAYGRTWMLV